MALPAEVVLERRRLKRRLTVWRVVAVVAVTALAVSLLSELVPVREAHVARLHVGGIVVEDPERSAALRQVAEDADARAMIVRINSPGGTTAGSEELYEDLRRLAERKPVVAVIGTLGASGGYIVALAADHIVARQTALTGSIGVMLETAEFSDLLNSIGINPQTFRSAPLKGQPSFTEPVTPAAREALQATIDDSYRWFLDLVRERRSMSAGELEAVGDGRVFTGRQAAGLKLVDALGGEQQARAWLATQRDVPEDLPTVDVSYGEEASVVGRLALALAGKALSIERLTLDGLLAVWQGDAP